MKTRAVTSQGQPAGFLVWCPACDNPHYFKNWTFNGDHERPTFSPSLIVTYAIGDPSDPSSGQRCHSFLVDGVWNYLDDCTHAMRGQKVPAPEWTHPSRTESP